MLTMEPYVPTIVKKVPATKMKIHHPTIEYQLRVRSRFLQLSYNHIPAYGWKVKKVPSKAPIKETRPENTGIALATMYAIKATLDVEPSHVTQ